MAKLIYSRYKNKSVQKIETRVKGSYTNTHVHFSGN